MSDLAAVHGFVVLSCCAREHDTDTCYRASTEQLLMQVGSILGKGGQTVSQIRRETGCSIRILQPGDAPLCAVQADAFAQVVQVEGSLRLHGLYTR